MRVVSKLAQIDFKIGSVERKGNILIIESHPDSTMKSTVYVSPQDVVECLKRLFVKPSAIWFFLGLPLYLYRWRRSSEAIGEPADTKEGWPTV